MKMPKWMSEIEIKPCTNRPTTGRKENEQKKNYKRTSTHNSHWMTMMMMMMIERKERTQPNNRTTNSQCWEKKEIHGLCLNEDMHKIPATELFMHAIFIILLLCECLLGAVAVVIKYVCACMILLFASLLLCSVVYLQFECSHRVAQKCWI